jgi:hypothetical protein
MKKNPDFLVLKVLLASLAVGLMSGCSGSFAPGPIEPNKTPIGNIQGAVHGGQAPISGAHIYLMAAGTAGYGNPSTSLINSTAPNAFEDGSGNYYVLTDANGNFSVGGDYTCTEGQQVYMVAYGGNPGLSGTVFNTGIVQMAALAQCPAAGNLAAQVPYLVINEVTTVAFAYAMGGFGSSAFAISSNAAHSPGSATAISNAMANANNIVTLSTGTAPATANGNPNSVNPQAQLYALANILATCVNSASSSSSACSSLFNAAQTSSGVAATDEANAIFNIVHNPANTTASPTHVSAIWNLMPATPVFSPTLTTAPTDWTMPVIYNGLVSQPGTNGSNQIISGPYNIAFDANGNAWIGDRVKGVVKVGPQGAASAFNSGFGMIKGVAVSPADGTIWAADYGNNIVDVLDSSGGIVATVTKGLGGNGNPRGPILTSFALDPTTGFMAYLGIEEVPGIIMYEANPSTPYQYTKSGNAELGSNGFPFVDTPGWIAVDQTGQAWLPSTDTGYTGNWAVTWKNGSRSAQADEAAGPEAYSLASDGNSNIWITTDDGSNQLEEIPSGATTVNSTTYTGGGMNGPFKLAIDGANTVWIANGGTATVSAFNTATSSWLATNGFSTGSPSITTAGTYLANSTSVTVASSTGIAVGYSVSGTGIASGTTVSQISGTTVTLSLETTAGNSGAVTFSQPCIVIGVDGSGNVWTGNADGSVTQLLGLATPTATPFYGGMTVTVGTGHNQTTTITNGNLGSKP